MSIEIERKFLVKGSFKESAEGSNRVVQVYLSADPYRIVRVRKMGNRAFITIKSGAKDSKLSRLEWEFEIPPEQANELIRISLPGRIEKTRYYVPYGKHVWEVDVFHDRNEGLIIAEIELGSVDEEFDKPDWIGEEVTGNPDYYNVNLIK